MIGIDQLENWFLVAWQAANFKADQHYMEKILSSSMLEKFITWRYEK
jgi:hypothetical protein